MSAMHFGPQMQQQQQQRVDGDRWPTNDGEKFGYLSSSIVSGGPAAVAAAVAAFYVAVIFIMDECH